MLRNLRNIILANPDNIKKVVDKIRDEKSVLHAKQLPFRYLSAYKEIRHLQERKMLLSLENALQISIQNIPKLAGTTLIAVDVSGSMGSCISRRSNVRCAEISQLLGMIANKICDKAYYYMFNTKLYEASFPQEKHILEKVSNACCAGGTDISLPFIKLIKDKIKVDRIIVISDNECNSGYSYYTSKSIQELADEYRKKINPNTYVHAIDLMGYGTVQFQGEKTSLLAGWSEKVFSFISLVEKGGPSLIETIENYM